MRLIKLMKKHSQLSRMLSYVSYILLAINCFILSRQLPFDSYSGVMNVTLIAFLVCSFYLARANEIFYDKISLSALVALLILLSYYSLMSGNEPHLILRFFLILLSISIAYHIKPDVKYFYIPFACFLIQAIVVIIFQILLLFYFTADYSASIRNVFISRGWGDVYNYGYGLWNIQLKGNSLLPFFFFISVVVFKGKFRVAFSSCFFIASIFSGNFAFILGFLSFFVLYFLINFKLSRNKLYAFVVTTLISVVTLYGTITEYIVRIVSQKSGYSGQHRLEQSLALIGDLAENKLTLFLGGGLGSTDISGFGFTFNDVIYFELQTLYIVNQMGFVFFLVFVAFNVYFVMKYIKSKEAIIIYISYLVYSFWNPYVFDTNHIVVIVVLVSIPILLRNKHLRGGSC